MEGSNFSPGSGRPKIFAQMILAKLRIDGYSVCVRERAKSGHKDILFQLTVRVKLESRPSSSTGFNDTSLTSASCSKKKFIVLYERRERRVRRAAIALRDDDDEAVTSALLSIDLLSVQTCSGLLLLRRREKAQKAVPVPSARERENEEEGADCCSVFPGYRRPTRQRAGGERRGIRVSQTIIPSQTITVTVDRGPSTSPRRERASSSSLHTTC